MLTIVSVKSKIFSSQELGEAIHQARREKHLTQVELAQHARVARGAIQKIESGRGDINVATLLRLLQILSLDLTIASRAGAAASFFKERAADV